MQFLIQVQVQGLFPGSVAHLPAQLEGDLWVLHS